MAGVAYLGCCWLGRRAEMLLAGAPQRRAIGKMLLAGGIAVAEILLARAPWRSAIGKMLLAGGTVAEVLMAEAPLQAGRGSRHEPQCL